MHTRFGDSMFYHPTRHIYSRPEAHGLTYESVFFKSVDGTQLHGWFLPAAHPSGTRPLGTIVHCHGNAGNISGHFENVKWLPGEGWNVLCFDYRGYGQSSGHPTRTGTVDDAMAAVRYVHTRDDVDAERIVVFGQSLGGSIGIVVAAELPEVRGIAVEGAFSHYRTEAAFVCRQNIVMSPFAGALSRTLVSEGWEPIEFVRRIAPRPTLFVCGTNDRIVDYRQTVALHEAAGDPKWLHILDGGGHTDALCTPQWRSRFLDFFAHCVNDRPIPEELRP